MGLVHDRPCGVEAYWDNSAARIALNQRGSTIETFVITAIWKKMDSVQPHAMKYD